MENWSRFVVPKKVNLKAWGHSIGVSPQSKRWNCLAWLLIDSRGGGGISERNACQQMRVEWVEVLSYELEKNVASRRSRKEGISSDETVKDFQRNAI